MPEGRSRLVQTERAGRNEHAAGACMRGHAASGGQGMVGRVRHARARQAASHGQAARLADNGLQAGTAQADTDLHGGSVLPVRSTGYCLSVGLSGAPARTWALSSFPCSLRQAGVIGMTSNAPHLWIRSVGWMGYVMGVPHHDPGLSWFWTTCRLHQSWL